ncbi:MAG: hypothetical protein ACRC4W_01640, partial [Treponemataceae bacterium]
SSTITGAITTDNFTHEGTETLTIESATISENLTSSGNLTSTGTVSFIGNATSTITGSTNFNNFTCTVPSKTLSFLVNTTQTITGTFTINGQAEGTRITLKILTGGGRWKINPANANVSYAIVSNSTNENANPIVTSNSIDGGSNDNWIFGGQKYTWEGSTSSDWQDALNWEPKSLPGKGSEILIPDSMINPPILNTDVDIFFDDSGTITVEENAILETNGFNLKAESIINKGTIKIKGKEKIEAKKINEEDSTIEYIDTITNIADSWGTSYENLIFSDTASIDSPDSLIVSKTTTIATTQTIKLTGANEFKEDVTITGGDEIHLNNVSEFTLKANAMCKSLTIDSPVSIKGNITTEEAQIFKGELTVTENAVLKGSSITFTKDISAAENTLTIDGGVATTGTIVTKNIVFKNTNNSIITGTISTANF